MTCEWVRVHMDRYLDRELGPATEAVTQHLAGCTECSALQVSRQSLRQKLRGVADSVSVPGHLSARVRASLDHQSTASRWPQLLAVAAAVLAVVFGGGQLAKRFRPESEDTVLTRATRHALPILRVGLQDHIHCAMFQKYPAKAPTLEALTAELGKDFGGLVRIVQTHVPLGLHVIEAHRCQFKDRKYIHVVARNGDKLISLVITPRGKGEAFENDLQSVVTEAGTRLFAANPEGFQVAGFETGHYLAYLISNTGDAENMAAMRAMTPELREVFSRVEI